MIYYRVCEEVDGRDWNNPQLMDRVHEYYFPKGEFITFVFRSESGYVGNAIGKTNIIPDDCKIIEDGNKDLRGLIESVFFDPNSWSHIKIEN